MSLKPNGLCAPPCMYRKILARDHVTESRVRNLLQSEPDQSFCVMSPDTMGPGSSWTRRGDINPKGAGSGVWLEVCPVTLITPTVSRCICCSGFLWSKHYARLWMGVNGATWFIKLPEFVLTGPHSSHTCTLHPLGDIHCFFTLTTIYRIDVGLKARDWTVLQLAPLGW